MPFAAGLALAFWAGAACGQPLSGEEVAQMEQLEGAGARASAEARRLFDGKAERVAEHYLRHTGVPPRPGAYFVVLRAAGDSAAALALIRALVAAPTPESGPEFESGGRRHRLPRHETEIAALLDELLQAQPVAADPAVASALARAADELRTRPRGIALGSAMRAVELLGRLRSDEARAALRRLGADPQLRQTALGALGRSGGAAEAELLVAGLADALSRVRAEAARALGRLDAPSAVPALQAALAGERDATVVDALVEALARLNALPTEPERCFALAERTYEAQPASLALGCWRAQANEKALLRAATSAAPTVRALALAALLEEPRSAERKIALSKVVVVAPPSAAVRLDPSVREPLLASAVQVLSTPLSSLLAWQTQELLLALAGGDMRLALAYADRIRTPFARSASSGRLAASQALARQDPAAYAGARRLRQAGVAAALGALALVAGAALTRRRAPALAAAIPLFAWGAATFFLSGARELPPLELAPLTAGGSAAIAAALVGMLAALAREHGAGRRRAVAVLLGAGALGAAAIGAFALCAAARWTGAFPIGGEGWDGIFEPVGAALAAPVLLLLGLAAAAIARR